MSSPDEVYFPEPGITKADVVRYFIAVGDGILGALYERPTTVERWPGGVFPGAKVRRALITLGRELERRVPDHVTIMCGRRSASRSGASRSSR